MAHKWYETPEYAAWENIKSRCRNPNHNSYHHYGARGIDIHESWANDFIAFLAHIGPRPSSAHSVDRRDVNKGYEPGNVRWATMEEQQNNRRNNVHVTLPNGKTMTHAQAARELGIPIMTLRNRIARGLPIDMENNAKGGTFQRYHAAGKMLTAKEWAELLNVSLSTIKSTLSRKSQEEWEAYVEKKLQGPKATKAETAKELGLSPSAMAYRVANGIPLDIDTQQAKARLRDKHTAWGQTLTAQEWATALRKNLQAVYRQCPKGQQSLEAYILKSKLPEACGYKLSVQGWADILGVSPERVVKRLAMGWDSFTAAVEKRLDKLGSLR